ncbi:MAG: prefoldin subunit alpha [Nanoarchaeota archaeon]
MEDEKQEFLFRLSVFEQQIRQLQQQINSVEEGMIELDSLHLGLDDLKNADGKEIFAPVGRGIYAKAKLISEDLTVDVGGRNFVKKTISETQEMIKKQVDKLQEIKKDLDNNLQEIGNEVEKVIGEAGKN